MRFSDLLDVTAGTLCVGCRFPGAGLCPRCAAEAPLTFPSASVPGIDRTVCAWEHAGHPRALILGLKLRGQRAYAEPLVRAAAHAVRRLGLRGDLLTWVPCRPSDLRRRGYDHAEVLARGLARELGLRARPLLGRTGSSIDQTSLGRTARLANLSGGFQSRPSPRQVVLVDDLVTTGATASACGRALREGGAAAVELVAICRA